MAAVVLAVFLDTLPQLPLRSLALTLAAVIVGSLLVLGVVIARAWDARHLKKMPAVPTYIFFRDMLSGVSFPRRMENLNKVDVKKSSVMRAFMFGRWMVDVTTPDLAKEVLNNPDVFEKFLVHKARPYSTLALFMGTNLVFSNGATWKRHRRVCNPAFHRSWPTAGFNEIAETLIDELRKVDNKPIPVHDFMQRLTLDALSTMAFGYDTQALRQPGNRTFELYSTVFEAITLPSRILLPILDRLPTAYNAKVKASVKEFDGVMLNLVKEARQKLGTGEPRHLLDMMVKSTEGESENAGMTDSELLFNMKTFFLAGHDTTANALACLLYLLACNQDVQDKARAEVFRVCGKDGAPSLEEQKELMYLTQCIKETLRIYPSVATLPGRYVAKDTSLGGYQLKKGDFLTANFYSIHHNAEYWPEPEKFDPERFSEENVSKHHPFQWLPFGGGQRLCIGKDFSLIEQRCVMSKLLQCYSVHLPGDVPFQIEFGKGSLLHPKELMLELRRRR